MRHRKTFFSKFLSFGLVAALSVGGALAQDITNADQFQLFYPSTSGSFLAGQSALIDQKAEIAAGYFVEALNYDWNNPVLLNRAFVSLLASGQIEAAEAISKRLNENAAEHEIAQLVQAVVALKERRYRSAETALNHVSSRSLFGVVATIARSWTRIGLDDPQGAYDIAADIDQAGLSDFMAFQTALMADVAGDKTKARTFYEKAYENSPFIVTIVDAYARFLANNGDFDKAQEIVSRFTDQGLNHPDINRLAGLIASQKRPGQFVKNAQQGTAELLRGLSSALADEQSSEAPLIMMQLAAYAHPKSELIAFSLASMLEEVGRYEPANEIYGQIDKKSSYYENALVQSAKNLRDLEMADAAIKKLNNIVVKFPNNISALITLGDVLRAEKRYEGASVAYAKALDITGGKRSVDWHLYFMRGITYERQGLWDKAEMDFKAALEIYPDQPQVLNYLGYTWIDMGIHLNEALDMIETAVALEPNSGQIVDSLGWAYYRLARFDDAVETLEHASRLMPGDPTINDHLGDAYWQVGRTREANYQWRKVKAMQPDEDLLAKITLKLENGLTSDK